MSIEDKMITELELKEVAVESVKGEKLVGSAEDNKKIFDRLGRFLATRINEIITEIKNSPVGKDKITEQDLSSEILEKLEIHTESNHAHTNKEILDGITEDKLLGEGKEITLKLLKLQGENGKYAELNVDHQGFLYFTLYNSDNTVANFIRLTDTYTRTGQILSLMSGGTGVDYKRSEIVITKNITYANSVSAVKCWYFPYLNMVFLGFTASVKVPKGKFVKIAQLGKVTGDTYNYPSVPMALTVSSYATESTTQWKGKVKTDGSIEVASDMEHIQSAVTIYISGFYFVS